MKVIRTGTRTPENRQAYLGNIILRVGGVETANHVQASRKKRKALSLVHTLHTFFYMCLDLLDVLSIHVQALLSLSAQGWCVERLVAEAVFIVLKP